jgi:predicted metalloprotease with PDZ domain
MLGLLTALPLTAGEKNQAIWYEWSRESAPNWASQVTINVPTHQDTQLTFIMPAWAPGAYTFSEYAQFVEEVTARDTSGRTLAVKKLDERSWRVSAEGAKGVTFSYRVDPATEYARRLAFSFSINDSTHATVQGPSTFMYVDGQKDRPVLVRYAVPAGWELATSLSPAFENGAQVYSAPNYDVFIDSPAEIGFLEERSFAVSGAPVQIVMYGRLEFDHQAFSDMVQRIVEYQVQFFDDTPFEKYVFLFYISPYGAGGGGLEHLNSANIALSWPQLKNDIGSAANVIAHEFFHLWNAKRIRPTVLGPFDYTQPACTRALWFVEGVTSYYADLTQVRAGLIDEGKFLSMQKQQIAALQRNADRLVTSVEKASLKIWERGYFHPGISYYNKGQLLGLLLDLRIRHETDNRRSLDDLMRHLNDHYAKRGLGVDEDELPKVASAIAGKDLHDFFSRYIAGVDELPFREYLSWAGLDFIEEKEEMATIGDLRIFGPQNRVSFLEKQGPAARAGVQRGDRLLEIDDQKIHSQADLTITLAAKRPGDIIRLLIEREGERHEYSVIAISETRAEFGLYPIKIPTERQQRILQGLVQGSTN